MRVFTLLTGIAGLVSTVQSVAITTTFTNSRRLLFDVDGDQIDAYGSKINYFNDKYYLYGNSFAITGVAFGIKSYSSVDLVNWLYEGFLYDPFSKNPCNDLGGCGRPHIIYNANTKSYVLWANAGSTGYVVATASSPTGPFAFTTSRALIDPSFTGLQPADFAVETFGDKGYLVFSALNFRSPLAGSIWPAIQQTIHISPLTSDFMNTTLKSYNVSSPASDLIDQETESPDIFMRDGLFYVVASNTCGYCNGSIALVYRSSSIQGPWTRQIIAADGCNSQVEGVLQLPEPSGNGPKYLWHGTSVPGGPRVGFSGHIFQPLRFNPDSSVQDLDCAASATFSATFTKGVGAVPQGNATMAADSSPVDAVYTPTCDTDQFNLFQTWTSSKTGTLKQVSVNIARSVQTVPLTMHVFKFASISKLEAPEYHWMELGNATYNATQLSYVFNTTSVYPNAAVSKGDLLGISIAGSDFAPYCYLEYDVGYGADQVLLQQGAGQYSWRGLDGKRNPVYTREGKGLKFFAIVE